MDSGAVVPRGGPGRPPTVGLIAAAAAAAAMSIAELSIALYSFQAGIRLLRCSHGKAADEGCDNCVSWEKKKERGREEEEEEEEEREEGGRGVVLSLF